MAAPLMSLQVQSQDKRKHVVPWKSRKDFLKIFHDIYGEDDSLHRQAIRRITTWKSRAGPKLSVAVESTGRLFECILNHKTAIEDGSIAEKEDMLRSSYGIAIIRFVNFVTERAQNKAVAQPVHILARQFGIPEWIVRIRHDSTHNQFPSLDMLSTAACWAVQYLKEEFWKCQSHDYNLPVSKKLLSRNKIPVEDMRNAIQTFMKLRFERMSSDGARCKMTTAEIKDLKRYAIENRFNFITCLWEDGFLIPSAEELEIFGIKQEDLLNQPFPRLPTELSEFWHPVLSMLNNVGAVGLLAKGAMFSMTDTDCLRNYLLHGWLHFILKQTIPSGDEDDTEGLVIDKSLMPLKVLLYFCLDNPNKFSFHLIKYLLDREELGDEAYGKLSALVKAGEPSVHAEEAKEEEEEGKSVYSVQDVKEASFNQGSESSPLPPTPTLESVQTSSCDDGIGWKICTDVVDWSTIPLGIIPSQEEPEDWEVNDDEGDDDNDEDVDGDKPVDNDVHGEEDDDNDDDDDDDGDDDDDDERHSRAWKKSQRKRSFEGDENGTSPKRSTYTVNDTELL